jgi:hypothetical protein
MDDFFARNRLSAYLDGELPISEAREVEAAIARSPALRAEYEQLRRVVEVLQTEGPIEAPASLDATLRRRLAAEPMPSRWRRILPRVPLEALALAAVALVALVVVTRSGPGHEPAAALPAPEPDPVAAAPVPPPEAAPPDAAPAANGILGDEGRAIGTAGRKAPAGDTHKSAPVPKGQREAYEPDWEKTAPAEPEEAPKPLAYSPPPYRYHLATTSESALKTLASVATELGGKLVDENGHAVATYPMEAGESRGVRIVVPSYNVEALHTRLRAMGEVETMAADASVLYAAGADVPVAIEVERE